MKRRRSQRECEAELDDVCWVLKLEKASGEVGYLCCAGEGIYVRPEVTGMVQRFTSRKDAERCAERLHKQYGLDVEEATPEPRVHDRTYGLWLDGGDWPDGISINSDGKSGKRYVLIREDGEELTTDVEDDVADMIVRLLHKTNGHLRKAKAQ